MTVRSGSSSFNGGIGSGPIFVFQSHCRGIESRLTECRQNLHSGSSVGCNHFDDVSVRCIGEHWMKDWMHVKCSNGWIFAVPCTNGDIKLTGSPVARAGIVLVCVNRTWGKVCNGEGDPFFASIACTQLGYSQYGKFIYPLTLLVINWCLHFRFKCSKRAVEWSTQYLSHVQSSLCQEWL
jgi:hypothetical protein